METRLRRMRVARSVAREEVCYQEDSPIPCPQCDSRAVFRLHRSSLEKLATALAGIYPYICKNCHTKFFKQQKVDLC